ncbi:MAG TPA: glycoside hydrolase family 3 N-terminal domain-containing protein [Mycobacteriales bacterium]|nr:glycoside hydrolase family 3 N-terminal domain-containing protein [Mycobacteriales bacterium]
MPGPLLRRPGAAALAAAVVIAGALPLLSQEAALGAPPAAPVLADFEGSGVPAGLAPFGNDAASTPTLVQQAAADRPGAAAGNRGLAVTYRVSGYGGVAHDLTAAQDWSGYGGFGFWVKGTGSGRRVQFEIKDGGTDAGHAELWESSFTDTASDWRQVQVPFGDFVRRGDYQPSGAPADGTLGLTSMWGYAVNLPAASGSLVLDDVAVYGTGVPRAGFRQGTYRTDPGTSVTVGVTVSGPGGAPLADDLTVRYAVGGGTAVAGEDFTAGDGTLTFAAGTPSGTARTFTVRTRGGSAPSVAKTIPVTLTAAGATLAPAKATVVINAHGLPYLNPRLPVDRRVADLLSRMSLADKVGQMTQAERGAIGDGADIATYRLGSVLSGGGSVPTPNTPAGWADMVDGFQAQALATPLQIPMIYGVDSVHGHNNLHGATVFPHNIGMGATRDAALVERDGRITATETRATGIPWAFSPCVCVARDERWGRTYESFGEDPALVKRLETIIDGLQDHGRLGRNTAVLATAKHFLGDGGTRYGSSTTGTYTTDQGVTYATQRELEAIHLAPYRTAVDRGVGSVMPSYSSLQILGRDAKPVKMHARGDQITGVLKGRLGFRGFVISDWNGIDQITADHRANAKLGVNAGIDMMMVPNDYRRFIGDLTALAGTGEVTGGRIDDAVRRILRQKFALGLFERPFADRTNLRSIGSAEHRRVAREAAGKSQVLLKNSGGVLPLSRHAKVYVAGASADDLGRQTGGWTLTWQGAPGNANRGTTILAGMRQVAPHAAITYSRDASAPTAGHDLGVVVVGENPYAEGVGDVGNGHSLQLSAADRSTIDTVCGAMKCVVLLVSGRPLDISGVLPEAAGFVASWLPGTEGAGVADVLFGARPFTGRLPMTWPRTADQVPINVGDASYDPLFPYGWGLRTGRAADDRSARGDAAVAALRDRVQRAVVAGGSAAMTRTAPLFAAAEHELMAGHPDRALALLLRAYDRV